MGSANEEESEAGILDHAGCWRARGAMRAIHAFAPGGVAVWRDDVAYVDSESLLEVGKRQAEEGVQ